MNLQVITLETQAFVDKVKSLTEEDEEQGWGTVYDIEHDYLTIAALWGLLEGGKIYVSPVLSRLPADEYKSFEMQMDELAGVPFLSQVRGVYHAKDRAPDD